MSEETIIIWEDEDTGKVAFWAGRAYWRYDRMSAYKYDSQEAAVRALKRMGSNERRHANCITTRKLEELIASGEYHVHGSHVTWDSKDVRNGPYYFSNDGGKPYTASHRHFAKQTQAEAYIRRHKGSGVLGYHTIDRTTPSRERHVNVDLKIFVDGQEAKVVGYMPHTVNALLEACEAFVEAWTKSHQLEKTDVALRKAQAAVAQVKGEPA